MKFQSETKKRNESGCQKCGTFQFSFFFFFPLVTGLFGSLVKERHWNFGRSGGVQTVLA